MKPGLRARLLGLSLLAGAAVMVLELATPRLVAPRLGTTALTWTTVIATFLGGIALGNAWGGRRADRGGRWTLPGLTLLAAIAAAATLPWQDLVLAVARPLPPSWRTLVAVPSAFLPVAFLLGALPPALGRALLRADLRPGRILGLAAAASSAGSLAGTFLAGYVLVPRLGTRSIFLAVALLLLGATALVLPSRGPAPTPAPSRRPGRGVPRGWTALAFLAGAALLAVEIVAGRIASDELGSSLYTWTAVIGVVLAGLALGAFVGGYLADRYAPRGLVSMLLLGAAAAVLLPLWGPPLMTATYEQFDSWPLSVLLAVATVFFVPSVLLGSISPALVRAALTEPEADGRVVGRLYAAGTLGAVVAATATGFWLVPALGIPYVLLLVAFLLGVGAIAAAGPKRPGGRAAPRRAGIALALVPIAVLAWAVGQKTDAARSVAAALELDTGRPGLYAEDSCYYRIRVRAESLRWLRLEAPPMVDDLENDPVLENRAWWSTSRGHLYWDTGPVGGRAPASMTFPQLARLRTHMNSREDRRAVAKLRTLSKHDHRGLTLDRLVHGYVDLQEPTWLGYDYERLYAGVVRIAWPGEGHVHCAFIGGGAYAYQRRLLASEGDRLRCVTAEIDPAVTDVARRHLGLEDDPRHEIVHQDARTFVDDRDPDAPRFDFVFGDAFNDFALPFHLTTLEFARALHANMTPDGVYLVNVIDAWESGLFLDAFTATLEQVFAHVEVLSLRPRMDELRETFVVVASNRALPLDRIEDDGGRELDIVRYQPEERAALRERAGGRILTDDHAPVEILLAPVVRQR